jgi:hypothetical protein
MPDSAGICSYNRWHCRRKATWDPIAGKWKEYKISTLFTKRMKKLRDSLHVREEATAASIEHVRAAGKTARRNSVAHESRTRNEKLDGFEFFTPEFNDSFPS